MRTTCGNENRSSGQSQISTKLEALVQRWLEAVRDVRRTLAKVQRSRRQAESAAGETPTPELASSAEPPPEPASSTEPPPELASITERSRALAALCDRILRELDGTEASAAEIRFVVHKPDPAARVDPRSTADLSTGELVWELRQMLSGAGNALEDVADTLDARAGDLDERGRELLQEEVTALGDDLAVVKAHLADPVDWDSEFEHLLAGEVAPFDDPAADDDDDNDA